MQGFVSPMELLSADSNIGASKLWYFPNQSVLSDPASSPAAMQALISQASLGLISSADYHNWHCSIVNPAISEGMDETSCVMILPTASSSVPESSNSTTSSSLGLDKPLSYHSTSHEIFSLPHDLSAGSQAMAAPKRRSWHEALSSPHHLTPDNQNSVTTYPQREISPSHILHTHDMNHDLHTNNSSSAFPCTIVDKTHQAYPCNLEISREINHATPMMNMEINHVKPISSTMLDGSMGINTIMHGGLKWPEINSQGKNSSSVSEDTNHDIHYKGIRSHPRTLVSKTHLPEESAVDKGLAALEVSASRKPSSSESKKRPAGAAQLHYSATSYSKRARLEHMGREKQQELNRNVMSRNKSINTCTTRTGITTNRSSKSSPRNPQGPALNTNGKPRARQGSANDPQSVAARNRRERINARLKVLQELVPNGSKVDLVTMLEKAINYVKFLQLQLRVLSNDDYWRANQDKLEHATGSEEGYNTVQLTACESNMVCTYRDDQNMCIKYP